MLPIIHEITPAIKITPHYRHHGTIFNCFIIDYLESTYCLACGPNDEVHVLQFGIGVYVLNIDRTKGYLGFNSYMGKEHYAINSVFLHNGQEIIDILGDHWEDMEPIGIASVLLGYLG